MTQSSLPLDVARIRALFPAFSQPELKDTVFLDNAAGAFTAQAVLDRLNLFYRAHKVQPYGVYPASIAAGNMMDQSYEEIAAALNVHPDWIHIGPSTSINTYVLGTAFDQYLKPGDAIIVTNQDHEANSGAWRKLAQNGIEVREWCVDPNSGHLDIRSLAELLDNDVKLVAFPHCSNIVGEINPAKQICDLARASGAISIVDGVSFAPHGLPDLSEMGCDIYLFSTYKTFGPHQGIMAIRPDLARDLPNQGHFFNNEKLRYRLTPAGPDHAQIGAVGGISTYLHQLADIADAQFKGANPFETARNAMRAQEKAISQPLLDYLSARNDIRLIGPRDANMRAPTISFAHARKGTEIATALADHNIMTAGGHFYAYRLLEALGIDPAHGVVRLSLAHYTSPGDIAKTITALTAVLAA